MILSSESESLGFTGGFNFYFDTIEQLAAVQFSYGTVFAYLVLRLLWLMQGIIFQISFEMWQCLCLRCKSKYYVFPQIILYPVLFEQIIWAFVIQMHFKTIM